MINLMESDLRARRCSKARLQKKTSILVLRSCVLFLQQPEYESSYRSRPKNRDGSQKESEAKCIKVVHTIPKAKGGFLTIERLWDTSLQITAPFEPGLTQVTPEEARSSAQQVPEPDPLPDIYFDTRPDPIHF